VADEHGCQVAGTGSDGEPTWIVLVLTDRCTHRAYIARIIRTLQSQFDLSNSANRVLAPRYDARQTRRSEMLQLVPAPPAPPEYCLLWADRWWPWADPWWLCMQKAEWSGWAQAVGALIALYIAIRLPVKARRDALNAANDMAKTFGAQLAVISQDFIRACDSQKFEDFDAHRHALADACAMSQSVPLASLRGEALGAHLIMRAAAVEIHRRSEAHTSGGHWAHWRKQFLDFHNQVLALIDKIHKSR
jgi:hypothetical protein